MFSITVVSLSVQFSPSVMSAQMVQDSSLFSTPSSAFITRKFFNNGHSDLCKVIPLCSFDLGGWNWSGQGGPTGRETMNTFADSLCCTAETNTAL